MSKLVKITKFVSYLLVSIAIEVSECYVGDVIGHGGPPELATLVVEGAYRAAAADKQATLGGPPGYPSRQAQRSVFQLAPEHIPIVKHMVS